MSLRKEQVLLILTVLMGAWCISSYSDDGGAAPRVNPPEEEYEQLALQPASLVDGEAAALKRRTFASEPSETRPLPPRTLSFPPRAPLTVATLPLDPGPDLSHSWLLAVDGATVVDVTVAEGAAGEGGVGEVGDEAIDEAAAAVLGGMTPEQATKIYARIWAAGLRSPYYGIIEPSAGVDLFALEEANGFAGVKLRMRLLSLKKGKLESVVTFGDGTSRPIDKIALADNLRNEVIRRVRKVPELPTAQGARRDLIEWLLVQARNDNSVYEDVLQQSGIYLQMSGEALDGLRVMQKVLRATGDIAKELELLEGIRGDDRRMAFKLEGLGVLRARLGLWAEAEQNLREAASLAPNDASPHGALAEFLRSRGRSQDAMAAAKRAKTTIGSVQDATAKGRILRTIVGCELAVGDLEAAQETLRAVPTDAGKAYLRGCIAYASGDPTGALASFRQAAVGLDAGAALLGQAACLMQTGEWQEAHDLFVRVQDQDPLLRHRAATGLALLFSRTGNFDTALGYVDRALEAAPRDAYALYLRGRTLRLMGQFVAAEEALAETLVVRDDFLHAIAEMSQCLASKADGLSGTEQAQALVHARRYADRAVTLSPQPEAELLELQGLRAFGSAQPRAASASFQQAQSLAADDIARGYNKGSLAIVEYSRGRVDSASTTLERMERDLGRDSELGKWAGATLLAIEDHALKEALGDSFDREKPGEIWDGDADASLRAACDAGRLVFLGQFSRQGSGEVMVERVGAVQKARNFLACSATVALGETHERTDSFCGLGIEMRRGGRGVDVSARLGLRDGEPFLRIQDGKQNGRDNLMQHVLQGAPREAGKPDELELRVVQRSADNERQLTLLAFWNGALVHTHELKQLTRNSQTELKTVLFASGNKGARTHVLFDDYQLERRKSR